MPRPWDRQAHPADVRRRPAGGTRVALSGPVPSGEGRLHYVEVGTDRARAGDADVPAHGQGTHAADDRTQQMGGDRPGDGPRPETVVRPLSAGPLRLP